MQKIVLCLVSFISTSIGHADVNSQCGDNTWITYKDEKCLRLFQNFETRNRAESVCDKLGSSLVTIKSADEQKFLTDLVYKSSESNSIWIGALRRLDNNTEFEWNDGSPVQRFTNWAIGRPSDDVRRTCVNLVPSILLGKLSDMEWFDTTCTSGLWFVCEKLQTWSHDNFQQAILATRTKLQHSVEDVTIALTNVRNQLRQLEDNPIPIGFIYVQLPNQPEPRNIWRTVQWVEITSEYAGLFFRVSGGGSAEFGTIQEEHSPRLTNIGFGFSTILADSSFQMPVTSIWSPWISTGANVASGSHRRIRFLSSEGEVRPRNHAVRIWMRTALLN